MDTATISLVISIIAFIISISIFFILNKKQKIAGTEGGEAYTSRPLQLQAYERLVMLSERIRTPELDQPRQSTRAHRKRNAVVATGKYTNRNMNTI
jgi:hypothetical protein